MTVGSPTVRFGVLGPVRMWRSEIEPDLGPRQQRLMLALLLARAGQQVSIAELVDLLWEQSPPDSAVNLLHRYAGALRRLIEPGLPARSEGRLLTREPAGYRLLVNADSLDLLKFRRLAGAGQYASDPADALARYVEALDLWRGPCAGGPELLPHPHPVFDAVDRERVVLARQAAEEALRCGRAGSVLPVLRRIAALNPLDEALQARLLLLLSADGKRAEAIAGYQDVHRRLTEELGVEPGEELRAAYQKVLGQRSVTLVPATEKDDGAPAAGLIGRRRELASVGQMLDRAAAGVGGCLLVIGPPGAGKTAVADAAATAARDRGLQVFRWDGTGATCCQGVPIWAGLARHMGADAEDLGDLDRLARVIIDGGPRLLLIDDIDLAGTAATAFLDQLAPGLACGATAILVTSTAPQASQPQLRLAALTERELAALTPGLPADAVHALWLASAGWPGVALELAAQLTEEDADGDAAVQLALATQSRTEFLALDLARIRLLESAEARDLPPVTRARVLARLARELLGDPSAGARRQALIDEAVALARSAGDPATVAEVLDCRLHALWDPAAAADRLTTAGEIVEQARLAGDAVVERRGLFWRFTALAELGDLEAAEAALTVYAQAAQLGGDAEAAVVVLARQAMLATVRGRFEEAAELTAEVAASGHRAGLADTDPLVASLNGRLALLRGDAESQVAPLQALARQKPGHYFEATAARALAEAGRDAEAELELDRVLPAVLAGSGPRWVGALADLAVVASRSDARPAAQALYDALLPYRGRLVVWGGANTITGPVDDYLGRLAAVLGQADDATAYLDRAVALERRLGALPWLAATLTARGSADDREQARAIAERLGLGGVMVAPPVPDDEWRLGPDGDDWRLEADGEVIRLRDMRGVRYLRTLLASPGREIAALDLVAGGAGLSVPAAEPVLDADARAAYWRRLRVLEERLEAADRAGDVSGAMVARAERSALVAELRRATGLGGRPRRYDDEAERARVNATRALRTVLARIEAAAPLVGAHLRASLRTGGHFRYQPAPGGPRRWRV